jgi:hypothetical protein
VGFDVSESKENVARAVARLMRSFKSTAGSRFNAARRLERHDKRLTRLTAFASAYVIILTILPYFSKLPAPTTDLYNLFTVILSLVIVISSLLQYSSANLLNAEQHHRSALEINELRRQLENKEMAATPEDIEKLTTNYNSVLQKYSINHEELDYQKYLLERPEENPWLGRAAKGRIRTMLFITEHLPNVFLITITIVVAVLIWRGVAPAM